MRVHMRFTVLLPAVMAAFAASCDSEVFEPAAASAQPVVAQASLTAVPGVSEVVGTTGPGSSYALLVPASWNGELVVYARGYVQPFLAPTLTIEAPGVRDWLLQQGYAVAYSSYSETGYAVRDGAQRTHELKNLFAAKFRQPERTYLFGISLGGLIVEHLSESFPSQYDGALSVCGVLGGGRMNADYVAHVRVLFDFFYPGVLPGSLYAMPAGYLLIPPNPATGFPGSPAFQAVYGALVSNPAAAVQIAGMQQVGMTYANIGELITGFIHVLGYQINGANALTERLNGHGFFDNANTSYAGSANDAAVNAGIARFTAHPSAANYLAQWHEPAGNIARPFVTLHTSRDPLVPARSADIFAAAVAAANASEHLLQRTIQSFGHCAFGQADIPLAFGALVSWVATGNRPAQ